MAMLLRNNDLTYRGPVHKWVKVPAPAGSEARVQGPLLLPRWVRTDEVVPPASGEPRCPHLVPVSGEGVNRRRGGAGRRKRVRRCRCAMTGASKKASGVWGGEAPRQKVERLRTVVILSHACPRVHCSQVGKIDHPDSDEEEEEPTQTQTQTQQQPEATVTGATGPTPTATATATQPSAAGATEEATTTTAEAMETAEATTTAATAATTEGATDAGGTGVVVADGTTGGATTTATGGEGGSAGAEASEQQPQEQQQQQPPAGGGDAAMQEGERPPEPSNGEAMDVDPGPS